MRKQFRLLFFATLFAGALTAQTKLDTLLRQLNDPKESKAVICSRISTYYSGKNADSSMYYAKQGVDLVQKSTSLKDKIEIYQAYSSILSAVGKSKEAISNCLLTISWAEELGDSILLGKVYGNAGVVYGTIGTYDVALKYYDISRKIKTRQKDSLSLANTLTQMAVVYTERGDFDKSQAALIDALHIFEKKNDLRGQARVYNNLGSVYLNQSQAAEGLKYYRLSLRTKQVAKADKKELSHAYANVGVAFFNMQNYDSALYYYTFALKMKENVGDRKGVGIAYNNIGLVYREQHKYPLAEEYLLKAIAIRREINDKRGIGSSLTALASVYGYQEKYAKCLPLLEEARTIAEEIDSKSLLSEVYKALANAHGDLGNFQKAYVFDTLYRRINDSMFSAERDKSIEEMKRKYESDKQEQTIKELEQSQRETQLKTAADKAEARTHFLFIGGGALLFVVILVFVLLLVLMRYRSNQRSKKQLQAAYDEIESKNKDITDSIRYAQRIQHAVLPEPGQVQGLFPQSFVLYKPKDIVSGDFYWVAQAKSQRIIAVADCTGHGVPGAFMSLVGTDQLNIMYKDPDIRDCAAGLRFIDKGIKEHLKQVGESGESRDGMDIGLCAISPTLLLEFSGALRPLLVVQNGQLVELAASRYSIGGAYSEEKKFDNHTIQLAPGDVFYLFTDGFADQFGGEEGKKFRTKRFKEVLLSISDKPMDEQKRLLEKAFEDWRGGLEQVDDVCVVGVRV